MPMCRPLYRIYLKCKTGCGRTDENTCLECWIKQPKDPSVRQSRSRSPSKLLTRTGREMQIGLESEIKSILPSRVYMGRSVKRRLRLDRVRQSSGRWYKSSGLRIKEIIDVPPFIARKNRNLAFVCPTSVLSVQQAR